MFLLFLDWFSILSICKRYCRNGLYKLFLRLQRFEYFLWKKKKKFKEFYKIFFFFIWLYLMLIFNLIIECPKDFCGAHGINNNYTISFQQNIIFCLNRLLCNRLWQRWRQFPLLVRHRLHWREMRPGRTCLHQSSWCWSMFFVFKPVLIKLNCFLLFDLV